MAPVTRRSQNSTSISKKTPARKRSTRTESQFEDEKRPDDASSQNGRIDTVDEETPAATVSLMASTKEAFNPLREMADKIGREVERFAITMDIFLKTFSHCKDKYRAVYNVVSDFKKIVQERIQADKVKYEKEIAQQLRQEWSNQAQLSTMLDSEVHKSSLAQNPAPLLGPKADEVTEMREWQEELAIWELFQIVLEIHYRPEYDAEGLLEETEEKLRKLGTPTRYTSEADRWERFILEDTVAKERVLVKRWLESTVKHQQSDVAGIVEELEARAGGGKGVWSHGWMHTREKIKGEKRIRSWPSASDPIQPQIRGGDTNELLITQLDPDALTKHQRVLLKSDNLLERAMWIACWEMLRRGQSWEDISAWCEDRNEGWRAFALGKAGPDMNVCSRTAWRKMCQVASESGSSSEFEAATFGVLGGSVLAVTKIARSVDDHLYAYYNGLLIRQFEQYLQLTCPGMISSLADQQHIDETLQDPEQAQKAITQLVVRLREHASTSSESVRPMKIVQSYLLAKEPESLVHTVGVAISEEDRRSGLEERAVMRLDEGLGFSEILPETEVALNPRASRIVAHISFLLSALRVPELDIQDLQAEENVMVSFIQQLRAAGKRDLIPLYASRLSHTRQVVLLSDVLLDVSRPAEQRELLSLLGLYGFSVDEIIWEQLQWITEGITKRSVDGKLLTMLERTDEKEYPGQRILVDFLPEELTENDVKIVRCLQWCLLLPKHWDLTFNALSLALRRCLVSGGFACALEIVRNFPYETVSTQKTYALLGKSVNLMDENVAWPRDEEQSALWAKLQKQSRSYFEMEQLVYAVLALSQWATEERPYVEQRPTPSPIPSAIKQAKREVDETMQPLLDGLLTQSEDEDEAADFQKIRQAYLPEMLIAYNTVLHTAGNIYTRDCLLESMDLSIKIAQEEDKVAKLLVESGRMKEMVESFAHSSKAILLLKAQSNKPWKPKKDREGKDPNIWDIGPQGKGSSGFRDGVVPT